MLMLLLNLLEVMIVLHLPVKRRAKAIGEDSINLYARRESGAIQLKYRLPTESEWEYAALRFNRIKKL